MTTDIAKIKKTLDQYIVRPANFFGLGGFVFDVAGEATVTLQNEISDHYAEDNSVIQDNIAVTPKRVVLQSFVGELSDIVDDEGNGTVEKVVQKLTVLNGLLPTLSASAQQIKESIKVQNGESGIDIGSLGDIELGSALDIYSIVRNFSPPTSKQEQAYQYFKSLREQKILISLQTPFEFMTSMAVEAVVARQAADTRFVSDFTVTLKEVRIASTETTAITEQGRRAQQTKIPDALGEVQGQVASLANQGLDLLFDADTAKIITDRTNETAESAADSFRALVGWL